MITVEKTANLQDVSERGNLQPLSLVVLGETTRLFYACKLGLAYADKKEISLPVVRKSLQVDTRNTTSFTLVLWQNLPHKEVKARTGMFRE